MAIRTILELELNGRGAGWTDVTADLAQSPVEWSHGISGNGVNDRTAGAGTAKFELVNQNPEGKYSIRHANRTPGFALGIGVRFRVVFTMPQGTGTGYQVANVGGYPAGTTVLAIDSGTGSIQVGDVVQLAGVAGDYVVRAGGGDPAASVTLEPGLAGAVADNAAITLVGASLTRHRGRLDDIDPEAGIFEARTTACESVDWMDDAAKANVSQIPVQLGQRADQIFATLVAAVPFQPDATEADVSPDVFAFALDTAQDESTTVLSELSKLARSELGLIYQRADGTVVFESRNRRALSEGVVDTFTDADAISAFAAGIARDDAISRVQVTTHPRSVDTDNETLLFRLDSPLEVAAQSAQLILAPYRDPQQQASRVGGTDMQTPVPVTDYMANSRDDGQGTDLTEDAALTTEFGGNGARILVENNGASTFWLTELRLRGRGIYDYQNVVLEAIDETAEINVGKTTGSDLPYQDNAALGFEIALWLLNLYKDPETLAESASIFVPRSDEDLARRVLSREISDRIGIVEQLTGFDVGVTGGHFIQSVNVSVDDRDNMSVSWQLAPANRQQFWLLEIPGRSELDNTTRLGFGLVVGHTDVLHCDTHDDGPHQDVAHFDTHTDVHDDFAHSDSTHSDSHDDAAHDDVAHDDTHDDVAHEDVAHQDGHGDVAHQDTHSDTPHTDTHGDVDHDDHDDHFDEV